jgi:hypothetical protein
LRKAHGWRHVRKGLGGEPPSGRAGGMSRKPSTQRGGSGRREERSRRGLAPPYGGMFGRPRRRSQGFCWVAAPCEGPRPGRLLAPQ